MKDIIKLRVMLESTLFRLAENIGLNGFFMKILASLAVGTIASLVVLLARLGLVLDMGQDLGLELVSTMSEAALVTKLAPALQFPVLAHFSLVLSLIIFDKKASFFMRIEVLTLGLNINLKVRPFIRVQRVVTLSR
jgi:hypothetical protein